MSMRLSGSLSLQTSGFPLAIKHGGTSQSTAINALNALLPAQYNQTGKILSTSGAYAVWHALPSLTPDGDNTRIQFNSNGAFNGSIDFRLDKITGEIFASGTYLNKGVRISGSPDTHQSVNLQTNRIDRWILQTDASPETGSRTGSNFELIVVDDTNSKTTVFEISRASLAVDFKVAPTVNGVPQEVGGGSVSSVSAVGTNGVLVSGSPVTLAGTIDLSLGSITPDSMTTFGPVSGTNLSGINTGDQLFSLYGSVISPSGSTTLATTLIQGNLSPQTSAFRKITVISSGLLTASLPVTDSNITTTLGYTPSLGMMTSIIPWAVQLAVARTMYVITNVAASTIALPDNPSANDEVWVMVTNGLSTNMIARNGSTIMGLAEDMMLDMRNYTYKLQFTNNSWRLL